MILLCKLFTFLFLYRKIHKEHPCIELGGWADFSLLPGEYLRKLLLLYYFCRALPSKKCISGGGKREVQRVSGPRLCPKFTHRKSDPSFVPSLGTCMKVEQAPKNTTQQAQEMLRALTPKHPPPISSPEGPKRPPFRFIIEGSAVTPQAHFF